MEVCRLCLDLATESDVKKLEGTYKDATQIVVPEVNTDISSSPVICQQCTSSLDELYTFKASVVEAENQIKEKVGEDKCQLRLKEVMTGVKIEEKDADLGKSKDRMCRTCLCAIEGKTFTLLKPTQSDAYLNSMLLMCLPEMDLDLTLDPVMCEQCLCNLQKLYHFKSSCLDVEERLNSYCEQHGSSSSSQINLHSVLEEDAAKPKDSTFDAVKSESVDSSVGDYKSEEGDDDVSMSDNSKDLGYTVVNVKKEERDMLKEEDDSEDGDESMGDDAENFTDEEIGELKQEELKIEDDDGDEAKKLNHDYCIERGRDQADMLLEMVKCHDCEFTTKNDKYLKNHIQRVHTRTELPLLKCDLCAYTSQLKHDLQRHFKWCHSETPLLKCDHCSYTSRVSTNLRRHAQIHRTERPLLICDHCEFTTKIKMSMKQHLRRYHSRTELPLLKCDLCDYSSQISGNLQKHFKRVHTQLPLLKCDYCDHTTKDDFNLKRHVQRRHTKAELPLRKCNLCTYTSQFKTDLLKHVKRCHTEDPLLKCDHCSYSCRVSSNLRKHIKVHHTERPLLKCEHCKFTTKINLSMKRHSARCSSQSNIPLLKCDLCDYSSLTKSDIQHHISRKHTDTTFRNLNVADIPPNITFREKPHAQHQN